MLRFAVLLMLLSAAPTAASAQGEVDPVTARLAERLQVLVGQDRGPAMRITGVRGEGRSVVLDVQLTPDANAAIGPTQVASALTASFCSEPGAGEQLFGDGRNLRFQVTRGGRTAAPVTTDRCPPHSGEGITAASFAAGIQSIVGVDMGGGTRISGVRSEGNTVIMTVSFPAAPAAAAPGLADGFLGGFCRHPQVQDVFFAAHLTLRIDIKLGRRAPLVGRTVSSCPGR